MIIIKTFKEILDEHFEDKFSNYPNIHFEKVLELMKLVRFQTMIEASDKADVDYNWINDDTDIEVYVLKESILGLDKNSIEI